MASPELTETPDPTGLGNAASAATASLTQRGNGVAEPSSMTRDALTQGATATLTERPAYFSDVLDDAERLLKYAAEAGIDVDDDLRKNILHARAASSGTWTEETAANLLTAFTKLAARVRPVTAESLKACVNATRPTVRTYAIVGVCLAVIIVPFSLVSFVTSGISDTIRKDILTANELAVKLTAQLGAPPVQGPEAAPPSVLPPGLTKAEVITELQLFASTIRAIDARARQLNFFVLHAEKDPYGSIRSDAGKFRQTFELPAALPDLVEAKDQKIAVHQNVRYFAQSLLDDVSVFYGAIAISILPVLYALLGTCAYLLRSFEQQISTRTFTPSAANSARLLIAAIGGAVVGLFNNFSITQGASIPPLAVAFLVGYAVDVFFSFLEGLIQAFTKSKSSPNSPTPTPSA